MALDFPFDVPLLVHISTQRRIAMIKSLDAHFAGEGESNDLVSSLAQCFVYVAITDNRHAIQPGVNLP